MQTSTINPSISSNEGPFTESGPDWFDMMEIIKEQAKAAYFYTIKMSEAEILVDNLVDPDATVDHYIDNCIGGLRNLAMHLKELGMPAECTDELLNYFYMSITRDQVLSWHSRGAQRLRKRKLFYRDLRAQVKKSDDTEDEHEHI